MPRSDDTYTVSVNLPKELEPRLRGLAEHRLESLSATCAAAIRDAIVHYEEGDTTRTRIAKIEHKLNMVLLLVWALPMHSGKVEITADDVRRFRELVAEIQL